MRTAQLMGWVVAAWLATVVGATAAPVPAEASETELREVLGKLNKEAGTAEKADAKLKALLKDKTSIPPLVKVAVKVQKEAKDGAKPFRFYSSMVLAKAAHITKEYDAAEVFYGLCVDIAINELQAGEMIVMACENQVDFYSDRKQYAKAVKACERFLEVDGGDVVQRAVIFMMEKKLRIKARNGEVDAAVEEIDAIIKRTRGSKLLVRQIRASILREGSKFDDSIAEYQKVLKLLDDETDISDEGKKFFTNNIKYAMSGIYMEQDKFEEGTALLAELVKDNPERATFRNDLGFVMADREVKLDEAEKLIREAVDLDLKERKKAVEESMGKLDPELAKKSNPAYLDSLGWVLYKKKKYDEALKYLLESAGADDEESNHIEIWDHVGDCYLAMDKKKEALETFQKALKMEDTTKKDAERRKKVTEKIKKVKAEMK